MNIEGCRTKLNQTQAAHGKIVILNFVNIIENNQVDKRTETKTIVKGYRKHIRGKMNKGFIIISEVKYNRTCENNETKKMGNMKQVHEIL